MFQLFTDGHKKNSKLHFDNLFVEEILYNVYKLTKLLLYIVIGISTVGAGHHRSIGACPCRTGGPTSQPSSRMFSIMKILVYVCFLRFRKSEAKKWCESKEERGVTFAVGAAI